MNPYDQAHQLARAIQSQEVYKQLLEKKRELDRNPDAKRIVEDFRKRQWEFERKRIMGEEVTAADQQMMQELQEALNLHVLAREYLQAEYQFGILFQDIQKIMAEAVQDVIDLPAL